MSHRAKRSTVVVNRKAIQLVPTFVLPWIGLGSLFKELKRYEEALAAFKKAAELDPTKAIPEDVLRAVADAHPE